MQYKILSIDGGGVKGLIAAEIIKAIESKRPGFIKKFDCFTGSSSGSIVAALLVSEHHPDQVASIFKKHMDSIFAINIKKRLFTLNGIISPIYEKDNLLKTCYNFLPNHHISELNKSMLIWSYDLVNQKPYLYIHMVDTKIKQNLFPFQTQCLGFLHEAVFHSCLAPTYFLSDSGLTDGGVFANNPAAISLSTLYKFNKNIFKNGIMLSIGYDGRPERLKIDGGTVNWLNASHTLMRANTSQGKYIPANILDDRFFRIEVQTKVGLDRVNQKEILIQDTKKWLDNNEHELLTWVDKYIMSN